MTFQSFMDLQVCKQTQIVKRLERSVRRKYPKHSHCQSEGLYLSSVAYNFHIELLDKSGVNLDCFIVGISTLGLVFHESNNSTSTGAGQLSLIDYWASELDAQIYLTNPVSTKFNYECPFHVQVQKTVYNLMLCYHSYCKATVSQLL